MSEQSDTQLSLAHLMRLAQQGDKGAYARLFEGITPILRAFVGNKLNRQEDAEDVVQEILISIHRASHTYDTDRPFKAWMFTIARYRLNDHLRAIYKNADHESGVSYDDSAFELSSSENVTETYDNHEYLDKMLDSLPRKQKKIVTMMKVEGYTAKETAKAMKMTETAVKVSAHRAYKALALKAGEQDK